MTDTNKNVVNIHGKNYMTVAGRVQEAGRDFISLNTEIIGHDPVIIKATVTTTKGTFTGISAANPSKTIEKMSPYEVAETSAVGRALGFAGFGSVDSIASADEMNKAQVMEKLPKDMSTAEMNKVSNTPMSLTPFLNKELGQLCPDCKEGTIVLNPKTGKKFCDKKCWLNKKVDATVPAEAMLPENADSEDIPF